MSKSKQLVRCSKLKDSGPESPFNTFLETDSVMCPHVHFFVIKVTQAFFCKGGRYTNFPNVFMVQNPKLCSIIFKKTSTYGRHHPLKSLVLWAIDSNTKTQKYLFWNVLRM